MRNATNAMILTTLLFLSLAAGPAAAAIWYVNPDGSGDFTTITAGVNAAESGDIVEIACGTYQEWEITPGSGVTVRGETGDPECVVILAYGGRGFDCPNVQDVVIEGLTVSDGTTTYGAGIQSFSSSLTVRHCDFRNGTAVGDGAISAYGSTIQIQNCRFMDNFSFNEGAGAVWLRHSQGSIADCSFVGNEAGGNGGALWLDDSIVDIRGCTFMGNLAGTGHLGGQGSAIYAAADQEAAYTIEGCTFAGNAGNATICANGEGLVLSSTIIAFNNDPVFYLWTDGIPDLSCCDLFGNSGGDWTGVIEPLLGQDGNISANPLFCDLEMGNLELAANSPCLPAANPDCGLMGAQAEGCPAPVVDSPLIDTVAQTRATLHPAVPNPFNPRTTVAFDLPQSAQIKLEIFDVSGHRIQVLHQGLVAAGRHQFDWEGLDSQGQSMPSGLYFCRLTGDNLNLTRQLTLIR